MASSIDPVLLPEDIMEGSRFGPQFSTVVLETPGGAEQRVQRWAYPRHAGEIGYGVRTPAQLADLKAFFMARAGKARGFLFKDHRDFSATDQPIGTGDGALRSFQLSKTYSSGSAGVVRKITRPNASTVSVRVDGTPAGGWTVEVETGVISFTAAPAAGESVTASFEFYVPVRFDTDRMDVTLEGVMGGWESIPIIEVRE